MPPKKWNRKKKNVVKKKYTRRIKFARPLTTSSGLPPNYPMRMKYAEQLVLTTGVAGVPTLYQFNLNSIFDPNRTGAGHQPYFRDQMAQFYDYYKVRSCLVKIVIQTLENQNMIVSIRPDDNVTLVSNLTLEMERPGCAVILHSQIAKPMVFKKRYYIHNILKMSKKEYLEDETLKTAFTANPTLPAVLNILAANSDTTSLIGYQYALTIVLEYDLMCQDITVQAQS